MVSGKPDNLGGGGRGTPLPPPSTSTYFPFMCITLPSNKMFSSLHRKFFILLVKFRFLLLLVIVYRQHTLRNRLYYFRYSSLIAMDHCFVSTLFIYDFGFCTQPFQFNYTSWWVYETLNSDTFEEVNFQTCRITRWPNFPQRKNLKEPSNQIRI